MLGLKVHNRPISWTAASRFSINDWDFNSEQVIAEIYSNDYTNRDLRPDDMQLSLRGAVIDQVRSLYPFDDLRPIMDIERLGDWSPASAAYLCFIQKCRLSVCYRGAY